MKKIFIAVNLLIATSISAMADDAVGDQYFEALEKIKKPPVSSTPVAASDVEEKKRVIELMNKSGIQNFHMPEELAIYKGNFSNSGEVEYAVVSTGGSMHANVVTVYKLKENRLVNANLDQLIQKNLSVGKNRFYIHVADPFAVTENGKTFLRFMAFPSGNRNYDKTKLRLCSYLWHGNQFSLAEPNWRVNKANNDLVAATDCIGSKTRK